MPVIRMWVSVCVAQRKNGIWVSEVGYYLLYFLDTLGFIWKGISNEKLLLSWMYYLKYRNTLKTKRTFLKWLSKINAFGSTVSFWLFYSFEIEPWGICHHSGLCDQASGHCDIQRNNQRPMKRGSKFCLQFSGYMLGNLSADAGCLVSASLCYSPISSLLEPTGALLLCFLFNTTPRCSPLLFHLLEAVFPFQPLSSHSPNSVSETQQLSWKIKNFFRGRAKRRH